MTPVERTLELRLEGVRDHLARRAWLAGLLGLVAVASVVVTVAWLLAGSDGWLPGSDTPLLLDVALVLAAAAGAFFVRRAVARRFDAVPLASAMETVAEIRRGVLRGTLELSTETPRGMSDSLAGRAIRSTARKLEGHSDAALAGSIGEETTAWLRRAAVAATIGGLLVAGLTASSPARMAGAVQGLASPFETARDPVLPPLAVLPGSIEVQRGTDVEIEISAAGRAAVTIAWQAAGDVARSELLPVTAGRAVHPFRTVSAQIEYRVEDAAGNRSETFTITPVDPLFVSDMVLSVAYPPHTGLPADEYRGDPPPLRLPAGTTLIFEGSTSRPLSSLSLVDTAGTAALTFDVDGRGFSARWTPRRTSLLEWNFRDQSGGAAEIQPEPLDITIVADAPPIIDIPVPGRDTIMPLNLRQPLVIEAGDDYGLRRVELVAYRITSFGERMEPVSQGFDVGGQRAILARPLLDLQRWGLLPGDTVRYFARAIDNGPTGQISTSPEYVLRLPEAAELRREAEEALEGVAERLEELAAEVQREAEENRDQALESSTPRGQPQEGQDDQAFEQREEMEAALEEQQQMSAEIDSMRAEMEALERMMEEAAQADPELRRQLEELQDLLSEMTGDELQQRMDDLSEALDQDDMQQANSSLEEMAEQQEEFRQRIEEALERFQRAALEQDFRATTSEAEELARQQQALADALKEEDAPELRAEQQQSLEEQAAELEQNMEELQERLLDMGEPEAAQGVQEAQQQASDARQEMQQAQQRAEQGQSSEAGQEAQEAADAMDQAAREMQQAMQEMAEQQMQEQQEALLRTADDALSLARRQAELSEQMRGASQEQLARMRSAEASLLQGVQNMAENLQMATEGAMGENRELSAQMGLAMESLQNTVEAMESRRGTSSPSQQAEQAVGDLNQLALMAIATADQMGQQGEGQSGEDVSEQLEQLAQQQGDLMNQSTQMMPMQLPQEAMSQQLQQMQSGQESVASDLGDLADEPGSEESLGDLQQMAMEAQAIAEEMAQGRLTPEVVQRQERLFHRLLDAGRSLEREEFSEERESEEPGAFERGDVLSLTADQLGVIRYEIPDGAQLQRLSPSVRQLVLQYFERLNAGGPAAARPGGGGS